MTPSGRGVVPTSRRSSVVWAAGRQKRNPGSGPAGPGPGAAAASVRWLLSVPCGQLAALARLSGLTSAAACPLPLWSGHLGVWDRKKSSFSLLTWGCECDKAGVGLREAGYLTGRCRARLLLRRYAGLRAQDVLDKNKDGCKASPDCPGQDTYRQQRGGPRAQESTRAPSLEPQDAPD